MKKTLLLLCLCFSAGVAFCQDGMITYSLKVNLPKEMEQQAAIFANIFPKSFIAYFSPESGRLTATGGFSIDMLVTEKGKVNYTLDNENKKAYKKVEAAAQQKAIDDNTKVTFTGKSMAILGYNCQEAIMETEDKGKDGKVQKMKHTLWIAKDLKFTNTGDGILKAMIDKTKGIPLKADINLGAMSMAEGFSITMVATKVSKEKQIASLFKVPTGYTVEAYDAEKVSRGMMGKMGGMMGGFGGK